MAVSIDNLTAHVHRKARRALLPTQPGRRPVRVQPSGRRRSQRLGKHIAERLRRPAAKPLNVAGHNIERTRREARLDADDDADGPGRQTRLRQSDAQLFL
jgi:hypothetical protein